MHAPSATTEELCLRDRARAEGVCFRCGAFVCAQCRKWQAERRLCLDCRERLGHRPSREATTALLVASLGLVTLLPGVAAAILAQQELGRISRCESSDAGETHARFARGLGIFEGVAALGAAGLLFLRFG